MKRFLTLLLSLIISLSSLMLINCKDTSDDGANTNFARLQLELIQYESVSGIRFTDNAPMYTTEICWDGKDVYLGASNSTSGALDGIDRIDGKDDISVFERFIEIYDEKIKDKIDDKGFYFINTGNTYIGYAPFNRFHRELYFTAKRGVDDKYHNPTIFQHISFEEVPYPQDAYWANKLEKYHRSDKWFNLSIYFVPVDSSTISKELNLEFSKCLTEYNGQYGWDYYINFYVNDICIGTCKFYDRSKSIPKEWYEWYFTTYLYRA